MFHHIDHAAQVRPRVQQAHGGFERIGVRALLNHAGAFAIVFAHHNQHAALHAGAGEVAQSVGRHVGADDGLPGHRAAQRVVDAGPEHRCRRGLVGAGLHVHAQLVHVRLGLHHHVQQMRHRRALVAAHIGHARLQQRLGDGQNAFAVEGAARAQAQGLDLLGE